MKNTFIEMESIFDRTKQALVEFTNIITPIIENAKDDHERLYWHHIYEEEDHRSDRLDMLMPKLSNLIKGGKELSTDHGEFVHLLQDISLEKFGLHNFLEHLDLSLFQFRGTEHEGKIQALRDLTAEDYQQMKEILVNLNEEFKGGLQFQTAIPTDEKEGIGESLKIDAYTQDTHKQTETKFFERKKSLTIGSLKQK